MEIINRFLPLMSTGLHYADTPEGQKTPLEEIQSALLLLAEEERKGEKSSPLSDKIELRKEELARFAVYAWIDEKILTCGRSDATAWLPLSLQCYFFSTTEGGREFYRLFQSILQKKDFPRENLASFEFAEQIRAFCGEIDTTPYADVARIYALCLLYGFRGELYWQPEKLERIRSACYALLSREEGIEVKKISDSREVEKKRSRIEILEPFAYVLIPLLGTICFGFYCASILSNISIAGI